MGRIKKKGTAGQAKNFITRTQAVRKLQISLPDFRRLCIFKGIYPREPRNKKKANKSSTPSTTFYYSKDIQYLLHEPLLQKFRDHKALAKKINRALGKGQFKGASRLEKNLTPRMRIDHIIRERYPTFVDAVRDLDDALCMVYLFANLPSTEEVPHKTIALCQRLCNEFEHYLIVSHSLRKSFLSIKGVYYQATIQGQDVLWLVPYKFVQRVTGDVDFRIMATFVDFYTNLLGFVNFRLYTTLGLVYPPKFNQLSDEQGGELGAFTLQGHGLGQEEDQDEEITSVTTNPKAQAIADALAQEEAGAIEETSQNEDSSMAVKDTEEAPVDDAPADLAGAMIPGSSDFDQALQLQVDDTPYATLFSDMSVFLSRESPRHALEFLLRSFGCKRIGWEESLGDGAFKSDENWSGWTHQVVDRPGAPSTGGSAPHDETEAGAQSAADSQQRVPDRAYVQPQWVWDCVNAGRILRTDLYARGATLPPHLSPWVKAKKGEYDPTQPLEPADTVDAAEQEEGAAQPLANGASKEEEEEEEEEEESDLSDGMQEDLSEDEDESADETKADIDETLGDLSDDDDDDSASVSSAEVDRQSHQLELEAEAAGVKPSAKKSAKNAKPSAPAKSEKAKQKEREARKEQEEVERLKGMMSKRKRMLYEKMQYGNKKREDEAEKLKSKRRKLEATKQRAGGKS
ncbi:putative ribosome biogenesis protein Pescadillo [Eremomyces bilateralis CBS 781.70]|uniref:Pescadillo homolog n=1 Tax=Eremomyces bilateralis CBS 781.70 TaxID=1392243 RepID=A0A6G1FXM4_9PEZI|nr:putative ribosome biogenesis protein Pescadillo [Eremomyces bilateralis CBS 781.70]KAF1810462.1 putative ribosome biogenesis protein Pescadillo [Eremomyces bilateralis CBS 781.70]